MTRLGRAAAAVVSSVLVALGAAVAAAGNAAAQEGERQQIRVRGGNHDTYGRLVFDWPEKVRYEADAYEGALYISFARRADFEFYSVFPALQDYVGEPAPGPHGYRVTIPLKGDFEVKDWTYGTKVVIDLKKVGTPATPGRPPRVEVTADQRGQSARLVFDWPGPVDYDLEHDAAAGTAALRFGRAARFDFSGYAATRPEQVLALAPIVSAKRSGVDLEVPKGAPVRVQADGPRITLVIDAPAEADPADTAEPDEAGAPAGVPETVEVSALPEPTADDGKEAEETEASSPAPLELLPQTKPALKEAPEPGEPVLAQPRRFTPEKVARGLVPRPGEVPPPAGTARLDLPWAGATAAAFARAGQQWLALEGGAPDGFARALEDALDDVGEVARLDRDGVTLVRLDGGPTLRARPELVGGTWRVALSRAPALPSQPIEVRVEDGRLVLPVAAPGPVVRLDDPATGGTLAVVPVAAAGQGIAVRRSFPEVTLLETQTGIAVLPKADYVSVSRAEGRVIVESEAGPLMLSGDQAADGAAPPMAAGAGGELLDLPAWRREGTPFMTAKQRLQGRLAEAPPAERPLARLELARFYFGHGMGVETLGALDVYTDEKPRRAEDPQVLLMQAASQMLAGKWQPAAEGLADPALAGVPDALPWRAAYASLTGAYEAAAAAFGRAGPMLEAYAPSVRKQLRLWAARARIGAGDLAGAEADLEAVRDLQPTPAERAQADVLQGRLAAARDEPEAAEQAWERAAKSTHPPSRAQARFVLAERRLAAGAADRPETIAELERLRYAWRGDEFEAVLLHRLADLYVEEARYGRALESLKQAAAHLSDSRLARRATQRMRGLFERLFLDGLADRMPALKALALYESFRELTPAGRRGDAMIGRLADRLVGVDLLTRAAELLEDQVEHRLSGVEQADVGARLAAIRLLDRAPEKALEALEMSDAGELPEPLAAKRRHLRARALAASGRPDDALGLLAGDDSDPALELSADIHQDRGNWAAAAKVLQRLLPPPPSGETPELAEEGAQDVMRAAVAMTLAGQERALRELSRSYADAMAKSAHAETFDLLDPSTGGGPVTVAKQLAEVQTAKAFMNAFRDRLEQESTRTAQN